MEGTETTTPTPEGRRAIRPRGADGRIAWRNMTDQEVIDMIYLADRYGDRRLLAQARQVLRKREEKAGRATNLA